MGVHGDQHGAPPILSSASNTMGSNGKSGSAYSRNDLHATRPAGPAPMIATRIAARCSYRQVKKSTRGALTTEFPARHNWYTASCMFKIVNSTTSINGCVSRG